MKLLIALSLACFSLVGMEAVLKETDEQERLHQDLCSAVIKGDRETVLKLIAQGASLEDCDKYGYTAMHKMAQQGRGEAVLLLCSLGANINTVAQDGRLSLHYALQNTLNPLSFIQMLVKNGASIRASTDEYKTEALHLVSACPCVTFRGDCLKDKVDYLLQLGVPVDVQTTDGKTALHFAANSGCVHCVKLLCESGASLATVDEDGCSPLHRVVGGGHNEIVVYLLDQEAYPDVQDRWGNTPLHWAAEENQWRAVCLLLRSNAKVNLQNKHKETALHLAAAQGHNIVVALLVEAGADYRMVDDCKRTALHRGAIEGKSEACDALLKGIALQIGPGAFELLRQEIVNYLGMKDDLGKTALEKAPKALSRVLQEKSVLRRLGHEGSKKKHAKDKGVSAK